MCYDFKTAISDLNETLSEANCLQPLCRKKSIENPRTDANRSLFYRMILTPILK